MKVHEFVDAGLGHSSYVIDVGDGTAAWEWVSILHRRSDYVTGSPGLAARSLHRFDDLPDSLAVLPAHGPWSPCSTAGVLERTSTLGHERATNPLLSISSEGAFVERLVDGPTAPLAPGGTVTVMCGHGERAMSAASLLATRGFAVQVFDGGPDTWATCTGRALEVGR